METFIVTAHGHVLIFIWDKYFRLIFVKYTFYHLVGTLLVDSPNTLTRATYVFVQLGVLQHEAVYEAANSL